MNFRNLASTARRIRKRLPMALLVVAALSACEDEEVVKEVIKPVFAIKVGDVSTLMETRFPGRAKAVNEVNRSFRVTGPLITRPVVIGDEVKKGDVIARIDPQDFEVRLGNIEGQLERAKAELAALRVARPEDIRSARAQVQETQAALTLAQQNLDRLTRIKKQDPGAVAGVLIDQAVEAKRSADARLRQAKEGLRVTEIGARPEDIAAKEAQIHSLEASVQSARDDLSYTFLRAPFDGTVVATFVENFEFVRAQQPIVRMIDPANMEFSIFVPENLINLAPYVTSASVHFDALPDVAVRATIKEIAKEASQATRTFPVTLLLEVPSDVDVLPGMAGQAAVVARLPEESDRLGAEIPATALFSAGDLDNSYVWVVSETNKTLSRREVEIGQLTNFGVRIRSGLNAGEWIVTKGVNSLNEGQRVQIIEGGPGGQT
ncbi:MAG: efflux RND transporter periplasmic adaptor subunit [Proteobacteria bacterium]|nr:efflux RND transporter periplasmic adaptor subunit [Pseudomonadota bacterium]